MAAVLNPAILVSSGLSPTVTISNAGDTCIILLATTAGSGSPYVTSIASSLGNTWTPLFGAINTAASYINTGGLFWTAFICVASSAGNDTLTLTVHGTTPSTIEYRYGELPSVLGIVAGIIYNNFTTQTSYSTSGGTTIGNGDNVASAPALQLSFVRTNDGVISAGAGFTNDKNSPNGHMIQHRVTSATGVQDATASSASATGTIWQFVLQYSGSNTYTRIQQVSDTYNYDVELWWCASVAATGVGTNFTITLPTNVPANRGLAAFAAEVSGLTGIVDQSATHQVTLGTSLSVANGAVDIGTKDFVATGISVEYGASGLTDPPGGTPVYTSALSGGGAAPYDLGYRINASALTDSANWSWTTSSNAGAVLGSFKSTTGAALAQAIVPVQASAMQLQATFASMPTLGNAIVIVCLINAGINNNTYGQLFDNQSAGGGGQVPRLLMLGVG